MTPRRQKANLDTCYLKSLRKAKKSGLLVTIRTQHHSFIAFVRF